MMMMMMGWRWQLDPVASSTVPAVPALSTAAPAVSAMQRDRHSGGSSAAVPGAALAPTIAQRVGSDTSAAAAAAAATSSSVRARRLVGMCCLR
jgi:hypothetical protein